MIHVRSIFFYYFVFTSRWYIPNYSMAEELAWGRNAGCRFAHGSCGEWIDTQLLRCQINYRSYILMYICNINIKNFALFIQWINTGSILQSLER